jgi:steroid 5-alpha reductase family enzyme
MLTTILTCTAICCLVMFSVWVWAYRIKNAGVVDIFWAFNFSFIAVVLYFMGGGLSERKMLMCAMILIWSMRLGIYLLIRVGSHLKEEEGRYKKLREEWAPNSNMRFFFFFQMQALSNIYLAIPFFLSCFNTNPQISILEYIGVGVWAISIVGEGIADAQLKMFKNNPANKGKVCSQGLWNYSRHPNYFFESMIWVGYFLFALNADYGWLAILSPITILFLVLKLTGIPMTEEQSLRSKGDLFREYQRTTSVFVPWFKKK